MRSEQPALASVSDFLHPLSHHMPRYHPLTSAAFLLSLPRSNNYVAGLQAITAGLLQPAAETDLVWNWPRLTMLEQMQLLRQA